MFWLLALALTMAGAGPSAPAVQVVPPRRTRPGPRPPVRGPEPDDDPDDLPLVAWSRFATGPGEADDVQIMDLPADGWKVELWAVAPNIDGGVRFAGGKTYGWNDPPPGAAPVVRAASGTAALPRRKAVSGNPAGSHLCTGRFMSS